MMAMASGPMLRTMFEADGSIDADDRLHLLGLYSGIPASDPTATFNVIVFSSEALVKPSFASEALNKPSFASEGLAKPSFSGESLVGGS